LTILSKKSEIYDALSFYYDNKDLIDQEIIVNNDEELWEKNVSRREK